MPVQRAITSAMSSSSTSSFERRVAVLLRQSCSSAVADLFAAAASLPYRSSAARLRSYWRSACSIWTLVCSICSRSSRSFVDGVLFRFPLHAQLAPAARAAPRVPSRAAPSRRAARAVGLFAQRLALDLELHHAPRDFVELLRHRVDLGAQLRRRFVDQIDRFVGQEAIGDVAVAHRRGSDERGILDANAVMRLVLLLQAAQDRNRVLDARLIDHHRLEAALERRILFDVFAVFVERRRADHVQLAAREHRLEQIARVHRALGLARADDGVQLVDEQDDLPLGRWRRL